MKDRGRARARECAARGRTAAGRAQQLGARPRGAEAGEDADERFSGWGTIPRLFAFALSVWGPERAQFMISFV